jgi:hypothetical protein
MLLVTPAPRIRLLQTELATAYRARFPHFARCAARHALQVALQTESAPSEALAFFDWLLDDQLRRFSEGFVDSWARIGGPFRYAAMHGRHP